MLKKKLARIRFIKEYMQEGIETAFSKIKALFLRKIQAMFKLYVQRFGNARFLSKTPSVINGASLKQ